MNINRSLRNFIILHIVKGWQSRILHGLIVFGLFRLSTSDYLIQLNLTVLQNIKGRLNPFIYTYESFLGLTVLLVIIFNIFFSIRSLRFQIFISSLNFILVNSIGFYCLIELRISFPLIAANHFLLLETQFSLFAKLTKVLREYRFVRKTFGKFVNQHVLDDFLASPKAFGKLDGTREMTVLFSDLRGFTSLAENMPAEDLIPLLNKYLDEMSKVVTTNDGTVDKFIGDAVMAIWNAPIMDKYHSAKSVLTALEMIRSLNIMKAVNPAFSIFTVGIGINTGNMIVGNVGGQNKYDYTVLGDNVNLGSRLEGLTKKYKVNIICSESTAQQYNLFPIKEIIFRKLDRITVKGKSKPIEIYQPMYKNPTTEKLKNFYEKGLELYFMGDFVESGKYFKALYEKGDSVSGVMIERIEKFNFTVPTNWSGTYNFDEK